MSYIVTYEGAEFNQYLSRSTTNIKERHSKEY